MWHIVLLPIVVVALGRLPRADGPPPRRRARPFAPKNAPAPEVVQTVVEPTGAGAETKSVPPVSRPRSSSRTATSPSGTDATSRYDIVKEFVIAFVVVAVLVVGLAIVFSSPDDHAGDGEELVAANDPVDFAQTAITELDGTSATATYGPPYNNTAGVQPVDRPVLTRELGRRAHPDEHGPRLRARPARARCPNRPDVQAAARASTTRRRPAQQQRVDRRLREGGRQRHVLPTARWWSRRATTGRSGS